MRVILNRQSLEWLGDHRIFFHHDGRERLKPGAALTFEEGTEVEPYVGFFDGAVICPCETMSFSNSAPTSKLRIGRYCSIGPHVVTHFTTHPLDHVSTSLFTHHLQDRMIQSFTEDHGGEPTAFPFARRRAARLGHDVWIGARCLILPGVEIGTGAVVGAGSVVSRPVGPYEVVAGNPARVVRKRFPEEVIARLLESEWWRYRFTDFQGLALDDPPQFLDGFERRKPDLEPFRPPLARMAEMPHD